MAIVPVHVSIAEKIERIVKIACGGRFTAALSESGRIYTWGRIMGRESSTGGEQTPRPPQRISNLDGKFCHDIACGTAHLAALVTQGWVPDDEMAECMSCKKPFTAIRRRVRRVHGAPVTRRGRRPYRGARAAPLPQLPWPLLWRLLDAATAPAERRLSRRSARLRPMLRATFHANLTRACGFRNQAQKAAAKASRRACCVNAFSAANSRSSADVAAETVRTIARCGFSASKSS